MSEPFVPLTARRSAPGPSGTAPESFRPTVLQRPAHTQPFIPAEPASASAPAATSAHAHGHGHAAAAPTPGGPGTPTEPTVSVERDGDRITRITVHCTCGHVIELACTS